ncbi:hypothetical protein AMECASPLE_039022, partial [Ameca splendens]
RYGVMRVYSPSYTPQANGVVERTIDLVKNSIAKNANSRDWSTKAVEIGQALNDRHQVSRPSPAAELNQRPFSSQKVGRSSNEKTGKPTPKVPFCEGQRVWVRARDHPVSTAVKPKYDTTDIVKQVLDRNTVLLQKRGIQGVEQLKPILS